MTRLLKFEEETGRKYVYLIKGHATRKLVEVVTDVGEDQFTVYFDSLSSRDLIDEVAEELGLATRHGSDDGEGDGTINPLLWGPKAQDVLNPLFHYTEISGANWMEEYIEELRGTGQVYVLENYKLPEDGVILKLVK